MTPLTATISAAYGYYFQDFLTRVQTLAAPLTEEEFWINPYPYGNSMGHLVLHITGNLNYYIGNQLAATGYVRDREREFSEAHPPTKAAALAALATAIDKVIVTLKSQQEEDWAQPFSAQGAEDVPDRFSIFLRCAVHFHHHIGHMSYIADEYQQRKEDKG